MKKQEEIDIDIIRTEWAHSVSYNPDGWELAVGEFDRAIAKIKAEAWEKGQNAGFYNGRHCEMLGFEPFTNPYKEK